MKSGFLCVILVLSLLLTACGRSKDSRFYVLVPLPSSPKIATLTNLQIGIDEISIPSYMEKNELAVHLTSNQVMLEEYNLWAEPLNKNIPRIIRSNLSSLLPGAVIENAPYDSKFKPTYQMEIFINQLSVNQRGESKLKAEYVIYSDNSLIRKKTVQYENKTLPVTPVNQVIGLNNNLNRLCVAMAETLKAVSRGKQEGK